MHSFAIAAAAIGLAAASPARISDYIRAAGNTPSGSTAFGNGTTNGTASSSREPCAIVSEQWYNSEENLVDAETAYQCLRSVPLHVEEGIQQVEGIKTFVQFQSTLAYLERPTEGFLYPAVDIEGGLDQIIANLKSGVYAVEYDLQLDIQDLIASAYDGHFSYKPDMFGVFAFGVRGALYSVSLDGSSLPEIYFSNDTHYLTGNGSMSSMVSPVVQINGQDVEAYLNQLALQRQYQDPDANYNALLTSGLKVARGIGLFNAPDMYPGAGTTFSYRNGTSHTVKTLSSSVANLTAVVDGKSFYEIFCTYEGQETTYNQTLENTPATPTSSAEPVIPTTQVPFKPVPANVSASYRKPYTYPQPVVANDDNSISGYFPKDNADLAVLVIPTFQPADDVQFANVVRLFLATAKSAGKKKLMIDLRGNGGGNVPLAYDLFGQLFPNIAPYGATNFRANQLLNDTGYIVSDFYSNVTNATVSPAEGCNSDFNSHPFNYREQLDENNQPFTSWVDYYGPHEHNEDNFTSLSRYNLADRYSLFCDQTSNYGNLTRITPQVFQPENVVLVQDGGCASTCAVFTEFMKAQAKVKQIVLGGRKQTGPMQGVGGVKGANVYSYNVIAQLVNNVETTYADETDERTPYIEKYKNITIPATQALLRANPDPEQGYPAKQATINIRNNVRYGDESATPLHFVYEAADCRLFYTPSMIFDQSAVWKAAYAARWANGTCVAGSTGHPSSAPDSDAIFAPPESARNLFGANSTSDFPADLNATVTAPSGSESSSTPSVQPYTGAASRMSGSFVAAMAVVVGFAALF